MTSSVKVAPKRPAWIVYDCPRCGASWGQWCRTAGGAGGLADTLHLERRRQWYAPRAVKPPEGGPST